MIVPELTPSVTHLPEAPTTSAHVTSAQLKALMSQHAISTKELAQWLGMSHTYIYALLAQEGAMQCRTSNREKLRVIAAQPGHLASVYQSLATPPEPLIHLVQRIDELNLCMVDALRRLPAPLQPTWVAALAQCEPLPTHLDDWLPWSDALWVTHATIAAQWVKQTKQWLTQGRPVSARFAHGLQALESTVLSA
jgi:hypothetical protein